MRISSCSYAFLYLGNLEIIHKPPNKTPARLLNGQEVERTWQESPETRHLFILDLGKGCKKGGKERGYSCPRVGFIVVATLPPRSRKRSRQSRLTADSVSYSARHVSAVALPSWAVTYTRGFLRKLFTKPLLQGTAFLLRTRTTQKRRVHILAICHGN